MITYFLAGLLAFTFLNYAVLLQTPPYACFMKPMNSTAVAIGPALQVVRGLIFSLALWPFRTVILNTNYGWLKLWGLLVGLSILSTTAAATGSVEGLIYTTIPVEKQVVGYLEVVPQTLLFSLIVYYWYQHPRKAWTVLSIVLVGVIVLLSVAAMVVPRS